jgi:hypothetical protein
MIESFLQKLNMNQVKYNQWLRTKQDYDKNIQNVPFDIFDYMCGRGAGFYFF